MTCSGDVVIRFLYAVDLLWHEQNDLRQLALLERKRRLEKLVQAHPRIVSRSTWKRAAANYLTWSGKIQWFKIRNATYSQYEGRLGLFEKRRAVGAAA